MRKPHATLRRTTLKDWQLWLPPTWARTPAEEDEFCHETYWPTYAEAVKFLIHATTTDKDN